MSVSQPFSVTSLDKAARPDQRLLIIQALGPGGVIIRISDLEPFKCKKFSEIQRLKSVRKT